jgi:hypothetical protein
MTILYNSVEPYSVCFIIMSALYRLWFKQVMRIQSITRVRNARC